MASILIIGDSASVPNWVSALRQNDHSVETLPSALELPKALEDWYDPVDIIIVDVANPDSGEAMPIAQAQSIWPGCKIIAVTSGYSFRGSAFYQMGLWSPDQLLIKPLNIRILCATVSFLWAQIRTERLRTVITSVKNCDLIYDRPEQADLATADQVSVTHPILSYPIPD
jgi:DNA-binding NtrC family response regulator